MGNLKTLPTFSERLLKKTGRSYLTAVVLITQLSTSPLGVLLAIFTMQTNARLAGAQLTGIVIATVIAMLLRNLFLVVLANRIARDSALRLGQWAKNETLTTGTDEELKAWRQVVVFAWRYIGFQFASLILLVILPVLLYMNYIVHASVDQLNYGLIAGLAAGLCLAVLEVFLIERLLVPARRALLPRNFEMQLSGMGNFGMQPKFLAVVFALILISVLLIAPIGYHQTTVVLYEEIGSQAVLGTLQLQSLMAAIFAILLGVGLSLFMARSISSPIRQMIDTFGKIEAGNREQRISVSATDEVGELGIYFNRMISRLDELQSSLELRVVERTRALERRAQQMQAAADVGSVAVRLHNMDELLPQAVELIGQRFGFYHVGIFLLDGIGQYAVLHAANSEGGKRMLARGHKLPVGKTGIVGYVTAIGQARIALDVGQDAVFFDNPDLPDTRSELAIPLSVGNKILGALDVQSMEASAFNEDDILALKILANHISIAIENAHLFAETQQSAEAAHRAFGEISFHGWQRLLKDNRAEIGYASVQADQVVPVLGELSPGFEAAFRSGRSELSNHNSTLHIPIKIRGNSIGAIQMDKPGGTGEWLADDIAFANSLAEQLSTALESARLFEETSRRAQRERAVSQITTSIRSTTDPQIMIQTALGELKRILGATEINIRPYTPPDALLTGIKDPAAQDPFPKSAA